MRIGYYKIPTGRSVAQLEQDMLNLDAQLDFLKKELGKPRLSTGDRNSIFYLIMKVKYQLTVLEEAIEQREQLNFENELYQILQKNGISTKV